MADQVTSLIICTTQRCGSTFFSDALTATGLVATPWEWLQKGDIAACRRRYGMAVDTPYADLVRTIVARESSENGVFSLKLMWDTFEAFCARIRSEHAARAQTSGLELLQSFFPNPRFILVRRRDKLKQAISFVKACQSGVWMNRNGEQPYFDENRLHFDYLELQRAKGSLEHQDAAWHDFLTGSDIPFLEIFYEDFVQAYEQTLADAIAFAGFAQPDGLAAPRSRMRRMTDTVNHQWLRRHKEVEDRITQHSHAGNIRPLPPDQRRASVTPATGTVAVEAGKAGTVIFKVRNEGGGLWPAVGYRDGRYWTLLKACWEPACRGESTSSHGEEATGYLADDLSPGEETDVVLPFTAPRETGTYALRCRLHQTDAGDFSLTSQSQNTTIIAVTEDERLTRAREHFGDPDFLFDNYWKRLDWFGYYYDVEYPWISHEDHGLLYCAGAGVAQDDYWFWDNHLGWWHTTSGTYPCLYVSGHDAWLKYEVGSRSPRRFKNNATGETLTRPFNSG